VSGDGHVKPTAAVQIACTNLARLR